MFHPTTCAINAMVENLHQTYRQTYGQLEPDYAGMLAWAGRMALETIVNSDALYHDVNHTIMVTQAGQAILQGKHGWEGGVTPRDWLHVVLALLYHDIGFVRGILRGDRPGVYRTGIGEETITLPRGATDASLTPYHVDRGKRFVRERFAGHAILDAEVLAANIERTRFPVPTSRAYQRTDDYPGLVRAADLIGQLADPHHQRKFPALFAEFSETGVQAQLGYETLDDLRDAYPTFYHTVVTPYIDAGLRHLQATHVGKTWIANLYAHVFAIEQHGQSRPGGYASRPLTSSGRGDVRQAD